MALLCIDTRRHHRAREALHATAHGLTIGKSLAAAREYRLRRFPLGPATGTSASRSPLAVRTGGAGLGGRGRARPADGAELGDPVADPSLLLRQPVLAVPRVQRLISPRAVKSDACPPVCFAWTTARGIHRGA